MTKFEGTFQGHTTGGGGGLAAGAVAAAVLLGGGAAAAVAAAVTELLIIIAVTVGVLAVAAVVVLVAYLKGKPAREARDRAAYDDRVRRHELEREHWRAERELAAAVRQAQMVAVIVPAVMAALKPPQPWPQSQPWQAAPVRAEVVKP